MDSLEEVRYPWVNAIEFWVGGYWHELGALHLFLGWLFVVWSIFSAFREKSYAIEFRFATLYFSLTVFTNFAFNVNGLNVNEIFGVISIIFLIARGRFRIAIRNFQVGITLLLVFGFGVVHGLFSAIIYPDLVPSASIALVKVAVNFKILVLAINLAIVGKAIASGVGLNCLVKSCVSAGVVALLLYLLQAGVAFSGTLPYGTFLDAGYVGVPSFASVSIERGHMGKFIAPYFVFFLYSFLRWDWRWRFFLFLFVSAINFSASGLVFFVLYIFTAIVIFRRSLGYRAFCLIGFAVSCASIFIAINWELFFAIYEKIVTIAFQGDESQGGGRSVSLFLQYIAKYPFGMGYGGSALRVAPNLPEINAAYFAFLSQYSFVGIFVILLFVALLANVAKIYCEDAVLQKCMFVGVIMAPIIFLIDMLWFVPLLWLPMQIIVSAGLMHRMLSRVRVASDLKPALSF